MNLPYHKAPALRIADWFNTDVPHDLENLRGRVVALHFFQMLCPGCVSHGLPQAASIFRLFPGDAVQVIGIHSIFEHHEVMTPAALRAFIHEYRIRFPVGIDQPDIAGPIPHTMQAYELQGTPSLVLIDRNGRIRFKHFGHAEDLQVGLALGQLLNEPVTAGTSEIGLGQVDAMKPHTPGCESRACGVE